MSENYRDFDEFFCSMEKKSILQIRLFDKVYDLPSVIPASTMLLVYRMSKDKELSISPHSQMDLALKILGEENVTEWCNKGLSIDQLAEIIKWAIPQITGQQQENAGIEIEKK